MMTISFFQFSELIHILELNPLWTKFKLLPLIRGTALATLDPLPSFTVWDSCLLAHELYRELCLAARCQKVGNWRCGNRNHPGVAIFQHWIRQLLNHVFYYHMLGL